MTGIDRWFVKFLLTTSEFAYYSFAVSTETLLNVFISPVITTMYNFICKNFDRYDILKRIKKICIIFGLFLISAAFPLKYILSTFLIKYQASAEIVVILFSTEVFYVVIKGVYVNYYKATKQQSRYLMQMVTIILIGSIFNVGAYFITKANVGFAIATLLSSILWYLICSFQSAEFKPDMQEILLFTPLTLFFVFSTLLNSLYGFALYLILTFLLCFVIDRQDLLYIIKSILTFMGTIKKHNKFEEDKTI